MNPADAQWTQTTSLPDGWAGHSLGYWSGFLYQVAGSSEYSGLPDGDHVFYAQVNANGTVGTWNVATSLPECVVEHAGVVANGFLYTLGGLHYNPDVGPSVANAVFYARINLDGTVGSWQTANPVPLAVLCPSAAVWNGRIYVAGGCDLDGVFNAVWSARIQADGSLSTWVAQVPLPDAIYDHAGVANGMLYVLGGVINNGMTIHNKVYFSRINPDGTLAGWNQTSPLPQPLFYSGAVAVAGRIFVTGGSTDSNPVNTCYVATVAGDGTLGPWSAGPTLPHAMYQHAMAVTDSHIFLSGGYNDGGYLNTVYSLALPAPPAAPMLLPQGFGTAGAFRLKLTSTANTGFGIEASTNLVDWNRIGWGFTDATGSLSVQDTDAPSFPKRFYRARWPLP